MKEKKKILIFDFDLITYRAAAVAEKRKVEVVHVKSGRPKLFDTRTKFKNFLAAKGMEFNKEEYTLTDIQIPEPPEFAFQVVKSQVKKIKESLNASEMEGFVGGKNNFRLHLELPVQYKRNREGMQRPIHLKAAKQYALDNYPGGLIDGIEVDDHVCIRWHELEAAGHYPVVVTIDKDQKACVGTRFYDWTKDEPEIVQVPAFGWLQLVDQGKNKKVEGLGLHFYAYQMLQGDPADEYTPRDLHGTNFGDKKAVELINQAKNISDIFDCIELQYKTWFPEPITYTTWDGKEVQKDYMQIIEMYHQLVYMKRKANDTTTYLDLKKEFT